MKAEVIKVSSDLIRIIVLDPPSLVEEGTIELNLFFEKKHIENIASAPYRKDELAYNFDFTKKLPRNIGDFNYVVKVSDGTNSEETKKISLIKRIPHHLSGLVKKIQGDFKTVAKNYNGSDAFFFKKIPGDKKCTQCWDNDLEGSNNSNCPVCGGTGKVRYFSRPYKTICGPIKSQHDGYAVDKPGKAIADTSVTISSIADMLLTTDDVIFVVRTGEFYRVEDRTVSEVKSIPVLQTLNAHLIPTGYPDEEICRQMLESEQ